MKKAGNFFALIAIVFAISVSSDVNGQGKGHDKGHGGKSNRNHRHENRDHKNDMAYRGHDRHHHERRQVRQVYHYHDRHCNHRPVVVHRHVRPRYIYYRDYDVYYDSRKSVYISYSGRSWSMSASTPVAMRHVNVRNAARFEVDYHDDDFPRYLERNTPTYTREYIDW
jgi:hypothetical protein